MSSIEKFKDKKKKISEIINKKIVNIKRGYDILEYDIIEYKLDNDICYEKSIIKCFNGFKGSIWETDKYMNKDINLFIKSTMLQGIKINGNTFYLDKKHFFNNNKNNIEEKHIIINSIR